MAKCKACGADVQFDPATQLLKCNACGDGTRIATQDALIAEKQEYGSIKEYTCPQCGGSIYTTDSTVATFCSFCGASVVLSCQDAEYVTPDGIIPFKITKEEAKSAYLKAMKKSLFAPDCLRNDDRVEKTRGIYMPYNTASYHAEGPASIQTVHHSSSGNYDITETRRERAHVEVDVNVAGDALMEFSNVISTGIQPFDMDDCKEYSPAYLAGFYADKANVSGETFLKSSEENAKAGCEHALIKKMSRGASFKQTEHIPDVYCSGVNTVLCPVWFISNKQPNGSVSYAAVNGQTGEVAAEIPIDKKRFFLISFAIAVVAYIALILGASFTPHNAIGIMGALALVASYVMYEEAEELYVHNKELEGFEVPLKQTLNNKPLDGGKVFLICFFAWMPTIFCISLAYELFGIAGIVAIGLGIFLILKQTLVKYEWFQKIFGRDYQLPKGVLTKYLVKPLVAAAFALLIYLFNPVHDIMQYLSAGIVFVLTLSSFLDIISVHNQMAGRKPAQLMKRGGDDNA